MKTAIFLGTRPEIIKLWSVIKELQRRKQDFFIVHTGQHYDANMSDNFFVELGLPQPKYNLGINGGTDYEQISRLVPKIAEVLKKENPDFVIIQGDTNTSVSVALTARKCGITDIVHVEAGLRSFSDIPEETNRVITDSLSKYLFCPTFQNVENVQNTVNHDVFGYHQQVYWTGNTLIDLLKHLEKNKKIKTRKENYILLTLHRQNNVDIRLNLKTILQQVNEVSKKHELPVKFVCHPRTERRITEFGLKIPDNITIMQPQGFIDFLTLEKNAQIILSDSGGCQEESNHFKVPCVVIRPKTERQEALTENAILADEIDNIITKTKDVLTRDRTKWTGTVFGNGHTAKKICEVLYEGKR